MARVRVNIEMNKGRVGVPLQKLSEVVKETETFLKMLAEDVELPRRVEQVKVDKIDPAHEMSEQEFNSFFGCAPNFTGQLTTQEFIDRIRGRNGEA